MYQLPTPRVWIGCLASYNAGELHGEWVDADDGIEALEEATAEILKTSKEPHAEEFHICDSENMGSLVGRYSSLDEVAKWGEVCAEHGDTVAAVAADHCGKSADAWDLGRWIEDHYRGEWDSLAAYVEEFYHGCGYDLGPLAAYIDWEAVVDGEWSHLVTVEEGSKVHVFEG